MRFQRTQGLQAEAMVPQLKQIDLLLKTKQSGVQSLLKDLTVLAMDGLKMMTYVYCDLSDRRRKMIQFKQTKTTNFAHYSRVTIQ